MYNNETIKEESWFKRNWKWVVPTGGCLSLIVIAIVLIVSAVFSVRNSINNSEYQEYALEKINQNNRVIELLGSPIEKNGISDYNYNWTNGDTFVAFKLNVSGPKGAGVLHVNAKLEDDNYTYNTLKLIIDESNEEVNLLTDN